MLARRSLAQSVPRFTKIFFDTQVTRFGRKIFTQRCLMPGFLGMKMRPSALAHEIICFKKEYYLSSERLQVSSCRYVFTKSKKEVSLRVKDKIPSGYILIYKAPMDNYAKYGQLCTSLGIVATVALSLNELYSFSLSRIGTGLQESISYTELILMYIGLASFVTVLHLFLNRFTVRMYHNPLNDTYVAVFFNPFGFVSKVDFRKGQVEPLKTRWPLPWKGNLFSIRGKTAILNEIHFRLPADYNALLEFDKETK